MKKVLILCLIGLVGCSEQADYRGKWFSFSDEGDYQELWIGEGKALSYLTKVDKLLLYSYTVSGDSLKFSLIESDFIDSHEFVLRIKSQEGEAMVTEFISDTRINPVKTYFLVEKEVPQLVDNLAGNLMFREEIFAREAGGGQSHEGHGH